jgi:hypothetical protein
LKFRLAPVYSLKTKINFKQELNIPAMEVGYKPPGGLVTWPEGKLLVTKFEFGGSFGMSLHGDCHEVVVTPNLESLVTFWCEFGESLSWALYIISQEANT